MKVYYNLIKYDAEVTAGVVEGLGGLHNIHLKLESKLLYGERHYLQTLVNVVDKFKEVYDVWIC